MLLKNARLLAASLLLLGTSSGCGNNVQSPEALEKYRHYLGASEANFLITSMHLNNELMNRIDEKTIAGHHEGLLNDQMVGINKAKENFKNSLELYSEIAARDRDAAAMTPLYETCITATKAVLQYLESQTPENRELYFEQRTSFVKLLKNIKQNQ